MVSLSLKRYIATLLSMCLAQLCFSGEVDHVLNTNPFARPVDSQVQQNTPEPSEQEFSVPFVLRGTMVAGKQSLANISGVILSLGEQVNGYKLVAIQQREIVLLNNSDRIILSMDDNNKDGQR